VIVALGKINIVSSRLVVANCLKIYEEKML